MTADTETRTLATSEAEYEAHARAKYTAKQKAAMLKAGTAMKNASGKASYPIGDAEDLGKAIKAVGRGGSSHDAIRKHIIAQAKKLGLSSKIPENWNSDGSLKVQSNSARDDGSTTQTANKDCPTCNGKGKIKAGNVTCPTCKGKKTVTAAVAAKESKQREPDYDLSRRAAQWRDGGMTFDDTQKAVKAAIVEALGGDFDPEDDYLYVQDLTDAWAVFSVNYDGVMYQVGYDCGDDGGCTVDIDGKTEVQRVTSYAPVPGQGSAKPLSAQNNSNGNDSAEERGDPQPVPVQVKRDVWSMPQEWSWPGGSLRFAADPPVGGVERSGKFTGYAAMTDAAYAVSDWLGEYNETMRSGSFAKTLREATVPLLFNHGGLPMASYPGTSELCEDRQGLRNDALFDLTSNFSNDISVSVSRGDLTSMSFSFAAVKQSWTADYENRFVDEARLYDTSVVTFPMNPATTAAMRSAITEGLGREGMGLMRRFADGSSVERRDSGLLVRSADEEIAEQAFRALRGADEQYVKQFGQYGRARTFVVGETLRQVRAGAMISAANVTLLNTALTELHKADDQLNNIPPILKLASQAMDDGMAGISALLDKNDPDDDQDDPDNPNGKGKTSGPAGANNSGVGGDQGGGGGSASGNPVTPNDGAGSRMARSRVRPIATDVWRDRLGL